MSKPAPRSARLALGALCVIALAAGCGHDRRSVESLPSAGSPASTASTASTASAPLHTDSTVAPVIVEKGFPTKATTGVPTGVALKKWTGPYRSSLAKNVPKVQLEDRSCKLFEGYWFDLADSGNYFYVDDPCVVLRNVRFTTNARISNTSAMVQLAMNNERLLVESSEFDGGPHHQRGIQADFGVVTVRDSSFTRFGNAAVEMNAPETDGVSFEMDGNYLYEPGGWDPGDHVDGFQVGAGGSVTIRDNTVLVEPYGAVAGDDNYVSNSALGLWAELGDVAGPVLIDHNLLAGGGYVMYLQQVSPYRWLGQVSVTNNVFDARFSPLGGIWGPLADSGLPSDLVWSGNTWNDGAPLDLTSAGG